MTTNSNGGIYRRGEGEPTEMEAFDALPSEVRVLLRECYFNWSAAQINRALRLGMSVPLIISGISHEDQERARTQ
jgi:hypothetical protein